MVKSEAGLAKHDENGLNTGSRHLLEVLVVCKVKINDVLEVELVWGRLWCVVGWRTKIEAISYHLCEAWLVAPM